MLHGAENPFIEQLATVGAIPVGAAVVEDFDNQNDPHVQTNGGGTAAAIVGAGLSGNFLRLADGASSHNAISFTPAPVLPFLIVSEFDFRIIGASDGFGFSLINPAFVPDIPLAVQAEEPGLFLSLGVGFDTKQDPGEVSDNHVSLHWNGFKVAEVDVTPWFDLNAGGDNFIHAKILSSPLRRFQGGEVSVVLREQNASSDLIGEPVTVIDRVFVNSYVNYLGGDPAQGVIPGRKVYFAADNHNGTGSVDIDNINVAFDPVPDVELTAEVLHTTFTAVENDAVDPLYPATADVLVRLNAPAPGPVEVHYTITPGTAQHGSDFGGELTGSITIPTRQSWGVIKIPLLNDSIVEGDESFTVTLTELHHHAGPATPPPTSTGGTPAAYNLQYDLFGFTSYPTGEYYPSRTAETSNLNDANPQ